MDNKFNLRFGCRVTITAGNTGKDIFICGNLYKGRKSGEAIQLQDEFRCIQTIYDMKFFKKHFQEITKGDVSE